MTSPENKVSNPKDAQPSKLNPKTSSKPITTGENKEDVIFTKDKSPDDLEILD